MSKYHDLYCRTFDNREDGEGRQQDCHHHTAHAFTLVKDAKDFRCGSMAETAEQAHNCRFEFSTDLPGRQFIQTHDKKMCKSN